LLIYGANGYVGEAAARLAVERGLDPVVAGRDAAAVEGLASELGAEGRVFSLTDAQGAAAVDGALEGVAVVLNMAGPFSRTAGSMVAACLRTGAHYLDITGEPEVVEALAARDEEARDHGVMLLPAAGLDSVPSDCLAAHLKRRLPAADNLVLGLRTAGPAGLPPGTQRTMIELAHRPERVIRGGRITEVGWWESATRAIDFGEGPMPAVRFGAADTFIAHRSTGIPNIEAFVALPFLLRNGYQYLKAFRWLLRRPQVQASMKRFVRPGPSAAARSRSSTTVYAEATDAAGGRVVARLHGPEGAVELTIRTALAIAVRALAGDAPPGYQTSAAAYGPDLVLEAGGVTREDVV